MKKVKIVFKIFLMLILLMPLAGCWDREELEDRSYVIGLGLDKSKHKGKIRVTMLLANPEVGSLQGGGGSTEKPREIITFDANDFIAAKGTANTIISRDISYDLLRIIVVSEEFAKTPIFVNALSDSLKDKEIRQSTYLAVSKEKASQYFVKNKPKMETRPHKYFQYMIDHGIENGLIPDSTLFRFFKTLERGTDLFLAMYTTASKDKNPKSKQEDEYMAGELNAAGELDETEFIGSAVFKNGRMIGKLTGQETRTVNILDDTTNIKDILMDVPDPFTKNKQRQFAVRIMKNENNKVKMNVIGERTRIFITIPLKVEIMTNPSMVNYTVERNQKKIKNEIANHIKIMNEHLFEKSQKELKGIPYPLSYFARKYFWTNQEYREFNWVKSFIAADIVIKPKIDIVDYGKQSTKPAKAAK
ncbi:Ger(x)C family spore germination protein [Neobacillus dielmonensis]|uniref:Ger(x)C family spore germination protein n=1 Tax=Neobacillus dielmonensis TaxID=1347369 RepID=UPI0005A8FA55|nr:Ger(x)C family spore germination protein [Neobacillus dielmonensis]